MAHLVRYGTETQEAGDAGHSAVAHHEEVVAALAGGVDQRRHGLPVDHLRVDETIVFHELSREEVIAIVDLLTARTEKQLEGQGIGLELSQDAKVLLADRGYDPTLGARPLRRAIQRLVEDALSERILWKEFRAGETVVVDIEGDQIAFRSIEGIEPPPVEPVASGSEG